MTTQSNKKPSHIVYTVREGKETQPHSRQDYWTKIGVAFAHNDGKGFSLRLEALPLNGNLTLRTPEKNDRP